MKLDTDWPFILDRYRAKIRYYGEASHAKEMDPGMAPRTKVEKEQHVLYLLEQLESKWITGCTDAELLNDFCFIQGMMYSLGYFHTKGLQGQLTQPRALKNYMRVPKYRRLNPHSDICRYTN